VSRIALQVLHKAVEGIDYLQEDHLGSPIASVEAGSGQFQMRREAVFGESSGGSITKIRLPGQYLDGESGLHYNYFRHYEANAGRYAQRDPMGLSGGVNLFIYVDGNPVNFIDPFGLIKWTGTVGFARVSVKKKVNRRAPKSKFGTFSNLTLSLEGPCIDGLKMLLSIDGEGFMNTTSWIPSPITGGLANVEIDDGMSVPTADSLMGALSLKGSGLFFLEGEVSSGSGRGTFKGKGLMGGDFEFVGTASPLDWNGREVRCTKDKPPCDEDE